MLIFILFMNIVFIMYYALIFKDLRVFNNNYLLGISIILLFSFISTSFFIKVEGKDKKIVQPKIVFINIIFFSFIAIINERFGYLKLISFLLIYFVLYIISRVVIHKYKVIKVGKIYEKTILPLIEKDEKDKAVEEIRKAIKILDIEMLHHVLAILFFQMGEFKQSLDSIKNVELDVKRPDIDMLNSFVGVILFFNGKYDEAEECFNKMKNAVFKNGTILYKANIEAIRGNVDKAKELFEYYKEDVINFEELKETHKEIGYYIDENVFEQEKIYYEGLFYYNIKDYINAKQCFEKVLERNINNIYHVDSKNKIKAFDNE